jgi:hypothetical protein
MAKPSSTLKLPIEAPPDITEIYESVYGPQISSLIIKDVWDAPSYKDAIKEVHGEEAMQRWLKDPTKNVELEKDVFVLRQAKIDPRIREWLEKTGRTKQRTLVSPLGPVKASMLDPEPTPEERGALDRLGITGKPTKAQLNEARDLLIGKKSKWAARHKERREREAERQEAIRDIEESRRKREEDIVLERLPKTYMPGKSLGKRLEEASRKEDVDVLKDVRTVFGGLVPGGEKEAPPSLMQKFQERPTSLTTEELTQLRANLSKAYVAGNLSDKNFNDVDKTISELLNPKKNINMIAVQKRLEALEKGDKDLNEVRRKLRNTIRKHTADYYLQQGMDENTAIGRAELEANQKVNAIEFNETFNYKDQPGVVSNVTDQELGIVYDKDENRHKIVPTSELVKEIFKRQQISSKDQEQIREAVALAYDETKSLSSGVFKKTRLGEALDREQKEHIKAFFEDGVLIPTDVWDNMFPANIKEQLGVLDRKRLLELKKEGITGAIASSKRFKKDLREHDFDKWTALQKINKKYSALAQDPSKLSAPEKILGGAQYLLQEETDRGIYETNLARALRLLFGGPGAFISAGLSENLPDVLLRDHDPYKRHKVITKDEYGKPVFSTGPKNFTRQAVLNWMTFQGQPEMFPAIAPLHAVLGDTGAWTVGLGASFFEPLTGASYLFKVPRAALKVAGATTRATGAAAKNKWLLRQGQRIKNLAHPLRGMQTNQVVKLVDDMIEGPQRRGSAIRKELDSTWSKGEMWDVFKKDAYHNRLVTKMSEEMSDLTSTAVIITRLMDAKKLTPKEFLDSLPRTKTVARYIEDAKKLMAEELAELKSTERLAAKEGRTIRFDESDIDMTLEGLVYAAAFDDLTYLREAAKGNPLVRKALEKSEFAARVATGKVDLTKATKLSKALQDELYRVNIARKIESGELPSEDLERAVDAYNRLPKEERTSKNLHNILFGEEGLPTDTHSLMIAASKTLTDDIRTGMLNYFPADMIHMGGDIIVPVENLTKPAYKAFQKAWDSFGINKWETLGHIPEGTKAINQKWLIPQKDRLGVMELLVDEVGVATIKGSDFYRDMLINIQKGAIGIEEFAIFKEILTENLAAKHFKGIRISELGEQWTRAVTPTQVRGSLFPTRFKTSKRGSLGYRPSGFVQDIKDVGKAMSNVFRKDAKKWKTEFNKGNLNNPPELERVLVEMQNMVPKVEAEFKEELIAARKKFGSTQKAADKVFDDTWYSKKASFIANKDNYIDRYMDGSYKNYLYRVMSNDPDNEAASEFIKKKLRREYGDEIPESAYREAVLDRELYMDKIDAWEQLLKTYYGNSIVIDEILNVDRMKHVMLKTGYVSGKMPTHKEVETFASKASNVHDPNLSTLAIVTKRLEGEFPVELEGKGLQSLAGAEALAGALMPWAMRERMANAFTFRLREFLDRNPEYLMDMVRDPLAPAMVVDKAALRAKYTKIAEEILNQVPVGMQTTKKGTVLPGRLTQEEGNAFLKDFSEGMTNAHIEALTRIGPHQRKKIIEWINGKFIREKTLYPSMDSIKKEVRKHSARELDVLKFEYDKWMRKAKWLGREKLPKEFRKQMHQSIEETFLGITKPKPRTFKVKGLEDPIELAPSDMIETAYLSTVEQLRDFWRASGATIGDTTYSSIIHNRPQIFQIKPNDPRVLMFGRDYAKQLKEFQEFAKGEALKPFLDRLEAKAKGGGPAVKAMLESLVDDSRNVMVSGLLGGTLAPGFRHWFMNGLTMPLIASTTTGMTGLKGSLRAADMGPNSLTHLVMGAPAEKVMFTDKLGRSYTAGELRRLYKKWHTGFSEEDVIYHNKQTDDLMNELGLSIGGMPKGPIKRLASKYIDPRNKNMFARGMIEADNWVRKNVFWQALKEGNTPAQSAEIARRSVYDYGLVDKEQKNALQRYFMFVSFRMMNLMETLNAVYRAAKTDKPGPLFNILRFNTNLQKEADLWLYGDDDVKKRLFVDFREDMIADNRIKTMGPMIPAVEAFESYINLFSAVQNLGPSISMEDVNKIVEAALDEQYRPMIDLALYGGERVIKQDLKKDGGKVPDEWIYWMRGSNTLDFFKRPSSTEDNIIKKNIHVHIMPMKFDKRRLESPTYQDSDAIRFPSASQYRYRTKADEFKAKAWETIALLLGQKRAMKDYANLLMAGEVDLGGKPELTPGRAFGKKSVPTWWGYGTSLQTPLQIKSHTQKNIYKINKAIKTLQDEMNSYDQGDE